MKFTKETAKQYGRKGGKATFKKIGVKGMRKRAKKGLKVRWG